MQKPPEAVMERVLRNMGACLLHTPSQEKFTDEDLEYWGNFYVENNLRARNILFATFISAPREIAAAVIFKTPLPLRDDLARPLPKQRFAVASLFPRRRVRPSG
jgi:hypothetical protein